MTFVQELCLYIALFGPFPTLKRGDGIYHITKKTNSLRRVQSLIDGGAFWIPRTPEDARRFRQQKRKRTHKPTHVIPVYHGEARPSNSEYSTVPLCPRTLNMAEIQRLDELGFPRDAMLPRTAFRYCPARSVEQPQNKVGEIVRTPFNEMTPAQREQHRVHNELMKALQGTRVSDAARNAAYGVIVLGKTQKEAALEYGLRRNTLSVTIGRLRRRMAA